MIPESIYTQSNYTYLVNWPMLSDLAQDYRRYIVAATDTLPTDNMWLASFNNMLNVALDPDVREYQDIPFVCTFGIEIYQELFETRLNDVFNWYHFPDDLYVRLETIELLDILGNTRLVLGNPLLYGMS